MTNSHSSILRAGPPPEKAGCTLIAIHGRKGLAEDMLRLFNQLNAQGIACLAPQAIGGSWWPESFLAPLQDNEPDLTNALATLADIVESEVLAKGVSRHRVALVGFSQGACLALETAARGITSVGAVFAFSGGLVGTRNGCPDRLPELLNHQDKIFDYESQLNHTQIYLSCHENDPVIPRARVQKTHDVLAELGANIQMKLHQGSHHGVTQTDIQELKACLSDWQSASA